MTCLTLKYAGISIYDKLLLLFIDVNVVVKKSSFKLLFMVEINERIRVCFEHLVVEGK